MLDIDLELNTRIMKEMGLEEGERRRVVDQDTEEVCSLGSRDIVTPGSQSGKNAVEFDVINNPRMMNKLFAEFVDKLSEEGSLDSSCVSFGTYQDKITKKNTARVMFEEGDIIESRAYKNEGLCLADLVFQLNGEEDVDLSEYDIERKPSAAKVKPKTEPIKRKMRDETNGSSNLSNKRKSTRKSK